MYLLKYWFRIIFNKKKLRTAALSVCLLFVAVSCLQLGETFCFWLGKIMFLKMRYFIPNICFWGNINNRMYMCVCVFPQCVSALVQPLGVCAEYLNSSLVQVSVSAVHLFTFCYPGILDSEWFQVLWSSQLIRLIKFIWIILYLCLSR